MSRLIINCRYLVPLIWMQIQFVGLSETVSHFICIFWNRKSWQEFSPIAETLVKQGRALLSYGNSVFCDVMAQCHFGVIPMLVKKQDVVDPIVLNKFLTNLRLADNDELLSIRDIQSDDKSSQDSYGSQTSIRSNQSRHHSFHNERNSEGDSSDSGDSGPNQNHCIAVTLITAKARVTPTKTESVSRLELAAYVIGTRLGLTVANALDLDKCTITFWTVSTNCLYWITKSCSNRAVCSRFIVLLCRWPSFSNGLWSV